MPLVVRLPPAFLIRQKSKIFATFPPGEGLSAGGGFGWWAGCRPHFRVVLSRQRTVPCLMVRFSWNIDINDPLQDKDDSVENLVEVHAMATQPMRS